MECWDVGVSCGRCAEIYVYVMLHVVCVFGFVIFSGEGQIGDWSCFLIKLGKHETQCNVFS